MSRAEWLLFLTPSGLYFLFSLALGGLTAHGAVHHGLIVVAFAALYAAYRNVLTCTRLPGPAQFLASMLPLALWVAISLAFYLMMLGGIAVWGRPPTFELAAAYMNDLGPMLEQFGISKIAATSAIASAGLLVGAISWAAISHARFEKGPSISFPVAVLFLLAALGMSRLAVRAFVLAPLFAPGEPIRYFLFPPDNDWDLHAMRIPEEQIRSLELAEVEARKAIPRQASSTNVILFVVDALRAQNLPQYGYARETMPRLQSVAANADQSATVPRAYSTCNESACGIISIIGSRFAFGFHPKLITLNEILRQSGYTTSYFLGGDHTNFYGLRKLYGKSELYVDGVTNGFRKIGEDNPHRLNDDRYLLQATRSLPEHQNPTYLHYHLKSVHTLGVRSVTEVFAPSRNYSFSNWASSSENLQSFINFYDNGIIQADEIIYQILQQLATKGYLKDTLVVVTSDHGEYLGEQGQFSHGRGVDEVALRIPLIFLRFGGKFNTDVADATFASQVDIAPTILRELGLRIPPTWHGQALGASIEREYTFFSQSSFVGLFDHRLDYPEFKYILDLQSGTQSIFTSDGSSLPLHAVDSETLDRWHSAVAPRGGAANR
jgi:glucan phosphoethanolaminetransferase (alkaline phosphatase superfamily)